ncbi:reverse transcriptase domain-containing protein [Tanacetum coccineum]
MISPEGIKLCPDKTEVVLRLSSPQTIKEVQSLNGKLVSLNRFLSKSAEKSLPLFKTLKKCIKKSDFYWTLEAEQAFKQLKQHLSELPMLVAPKPKEELIVYLSASHGAISAVLMTERNKILADFLVEKLDEAPPDTLVVETPQDSWTLFMDGSSCVDGSGAGLILTSPEGTKFTYTLRFQFTASNNEAEYEALIVGLCIAAQMGVRNVHKSIQEEEVVTVVKEEGPTWMTPIMKYLKDGTFPDDRKEASKLRIKARQYELFEGVLYRRSFLKSWLRNTVCGGQSHAAGILLANYASGCTGYDTQWIEVKAVATITGSQVKKFVWDNIVCRFGLLGEIVSDNGKHFSDNSFKDWCEKLNITQRFASVKHSLSNGLVERANRSLGEGIKARLGEGNKNWIEEIPHVLWAHRTLIKSSHVDVVHNDEELRLNLDLLEERRERAAIQEAKAKLKMTNNEASHAVDGGKLSPKWEGSYEVTEALGDGAYRLRSMDGTVLPRMWNIANLKKCFL